MIFTEIFLFKLPLVVSLPEFALQFSGWQATFQRVHRFPEFLSDSYVLSKITVSGTGTNENLATRFIETIRHDIRGRP